MIMALLQARFSSSRLPGKVLKPILGEPMLARQIERVRRALLIDKLVVATSGDVTDDPIEILCLSLSVECFRGSLDDVLDRFYQAAKPFNPEHVVRLTGDCPLTDPKVIDDVITIHCAGGYDYTSNCLEPTFPDGLDVEVVRFTCLEDAWREAVLPSEREHVTPFIHQQPGRFKTGSFTNPIDMSYLRWTVDEPEDLELVIRVYSELYPVNPAFTTEDILALQDKNKELQALNLRFKRNEGYAKSLRKDVELLS